jgi:hypothetical protein
MLAAIEVEGDHVGLVTVSPTKRRVLHVVTSPATLFSPRISPTGDKVAVIHRPSPDAPPELFVFDVGGGIALRLDNAWRADWIPPHVDRPLLLAVLTGRRHFEGDDRPGDPSSASPDSVEAWELADCFSQSIALIEPSTGQEVDHVGPNFRTRYCGAHEEEMIFVYESHLVSGDRSHSTSRNTCSIGRYNFESHETSHTPIDICLDEAEVTEDGSLIGESRGTQLTQRWPLGALIRVSSNDGAFEVVSTHSHAEVSLPRSPPRGLSQLIELTPTNVTPEPTPVMVFVVDL